MAYPTVVVSSIMNSAAALQNNVSKTIYPFSVQIPYLNMALKELQELFELNSVPVTDKTSAEITIPASNGIVEIGFAPDSPIPNTPYLPNDLVEPQVLWEREFNVNPYVPMTKVGIFPQYLVGIEIQQFLFYIWENQKIQVLGCVQINQIKMEYTRFLFAEITAEDDEIDIINSESFLQYRTAGLLARFVGENPTRADSLDNDAALAIDRVLGVGAKGRQTIMTRHRPFRSSYKRRTFS